jgi:hypothetical protein
MDYVVHQMEWTKTTHQHQSHDPPPSTSQVLEYEECATTSGDKTSDTKI